MDRLAVEQRLMRLAEEGTISWTDLVQELMESVSDPELEVLYFDGYAGYDPTPLAEKD